MQQSQHLCPSAPVTLLHGDYRWECRNGINPEPEAQVVFGDDPFVSFVHLCLRVDCCCEECHNEVDEEACVNNCVHNLYLYRVFRVES